MIVLIALLLALIVPGVAAAQEARCAAIEAAGGICICSEPMNTSTFIFPPGTANFGVGFPDGGTKKCAWEGAAGNVGEALDDPNIRGKLFMRNDAATINALTGTGVPSFVFSSINNEGNGALVLGHSLLPQQLIPRVAMRWYRFYSSNFQLANFNDTDCYNSGKEAAINMYGSGPGGVVQTSSGAHGWQFYGFPNPPWVNFPNNCCTIAPGHETFVGNLNTATFHSPQTPGTNDLQGRWMRYEYIVNNANAATGWTFEMYGQDVTRGITRLNGGAEFRIMNTAMTCNGAAGPPDGCGPFADNWTTTQTTQFGASGFFMKAIWIDAFRSNPNTCAGFHAFSHLIAARWTTNAGQRIGAASEIETGAGPTPPAAPTGLRFASLVGLLAAAGALAFRYSRVAS
jgi:hypothetical protein